MSLSTLPRPVSALSRGGHEHTRSCYWDHRECRWACPGHVPAPPRSSQVPSPRPSAES
jgi:hypothetical protein